MSRRTAEPIADPWQTSPTFVDGLAAMETIGSVTHLVFTARQTGAYEGAQRERVVQARLIVPTDQLPMIARQLLVF